MGSREQQFHEERPWYVSVLSGSICQGSGRAVCYWPLSLRGADRRCPEPRGHCLRSRPAGVRTWEGDAPPHGMRRPSVRVTCESAGRVSRPAQPGRSGGSPTHVGEARRCGRRGGCQAWGGRPAATPRSRRRAPCRWPRSRRGRPSRRRRTRSPQRASSAAPHFTPEIHPERLCISISAGLRTI